MRNLNDIFDIENSNYVECQLDLAVEQVIDGNKYDAKLHFADLIYDEISSIAKYNGPDQHLFRFTKLTTLDKGKPTEKKPVIEDISECKLTFGNPNNFNDPMDPILREWLKIKRKSAKSTLMKNVYSYLAESLENLRICCLAKKRTETYDDVQFNPLMWAHYASMHKGICIEYIVTKEAIEAHNNTHQVMRIGDVRYRDHKPMSDYITLDNALLAKGGCWNYEKESRMIFYDKSIKRDNYVSIGGFQIKAIYLGIRISRSDRMDVLEVARKNSIDVYQVHFDSNDITRLVASKIDMHLDDN